MFILYLYHWFTGYVYFCAKGGFCERFLNLCAAANISVWQTKIKNGNLYGKMLAKDYKHIRHFAFMAQTHPHIIRKSGLKYRILHYRGRYGIISGIILFFVIINIFSMFIWNVNISGNSKVNSEKILSELKNCGVYEGAVRNNTDCEKCRQQLLINMPQLSWAAINIDGCFTTVDVRETNEKKMEKVTDYPANIVANTGGTILSIKAYYGVPEIAVGEAVAKGDMLVSGTMQTKTGSIIYTRARAQIMAQTIHKVTAKVSFKQTKFVETGEKPTRQIIEIFGIKTALFLGEIEKPYKVNRETYIPVINKKRLPIKVYSATFSKQEKVTYTIDEKTAKNNALKTAQNKAEKTLGKIIIKQDNVEYKTEKNGVFVSIDYICKEDIATPKKILIN